MNAQIAQVLSTYYRRPLVRLFAAITVVLAGIMVVIGMNGSSGGIMIAPDISSSGNRAYLYSNNPEDRVLRYPPEEIDFLSVSDSTRAPNVDLTPFQNATGLRISNSKLTLERVEQIASMAKLNSLELTADTLPDGTWELLGPKLTLLEIPARLLREYPDEVTQLDRLQVLRINRDALDDVTMEVVTKIPNLKTLVLSHSVVDTFAPANTPPSPPLSWTPAALHPLQNHAHLRSIFVDWPYPTSRTTAELPGVTLYMATASRSLTYALFTGLFFSAALSILVALQVWAHFTTQHSVIIPNYDRPHLVVVASILLGGSLLASILLWVAQVAWLSAIALSLGIPALVVAILAGTQSSSQIVRALSTALAMLVGVMIWIPWLLTMTSPVIAGEMMWFFHGELWIWAIALLLLEAAILGIGLSRLPSIARQVYERSSIHPGFSPWDPQQQRRAAYGSKLWWMKFWDLQSFPSLAGGSLWQKAKLWRLGNGYRPMVVTLAMGVTFFGIALGTGILSQRVLTQQPFFHGFIIQFGVMLTIMPIPIWYKRCKQLKIELLRPVGRGDLIRQLFAALAADQLWALPILVLAMFFSLYQISESFPFRPWAMLPLPFAIWIWFFSLATSVFAIRRVWVLVAYMVSMSVISFTIPITTLVVMSIYEVSFDVVAQLGYVFDLALLAAAVIVVRTTYQHAVNREWGL